MTPEHLFQDETATSVAGFCGGASFFPEDRLGTSLFQLTAMVIVDPCPRKATCQKLLLILVLQETSCVILPEPRR
jgi:hypothetical protein